MRLCHRHHHHATCYANLRECGDIQCPDPTLLACSESAMRLCTNVQRENLMSVGTCFGKFTHSKKFRLHITCLDYLAQYAKYKAWVKPSSEMAFLYGNHILKSALGRITEDTPRWPPFRSVFSNADTYLCFCRCRYQGVVIYNMADVPIGACLDTAHAAMLS